MAHLFFFLCFFNFRLNSLVVPASYSAATASSIKFVPVNRNGPGATKSDGESRSSRGEVETLHAEAQVLPGQPGSVKDHSIFQLKLPLNRGNA